MESKSVILMLMMLIMLIPTICDDIPGEVCHGKTAKKNDGGAGYLTVKCHVILQLVDASFGALYKP